MAKGMPYALTVGMGMRESHCDIITPGIDVSESTIRPCPVNVNKPVSDLCLSVSARNEPPSAHEAEKGLTKGQHASGLKLHLNSNGEKFHCVIGIDTTVLREWHSQAIPAARKD